MCCFDVQQKQFGPNSDSAGVTEAKSDQNEYLNLLNSPSVVQMGGGDTRRLTQTQTNRCTYPYILWLS